MTNVAPTTLWEFNETPAPLSPAIEPTTEPVPDAPAPAEHVAEHVAEAEVATDEAVAPDAVTLTRLQEKESYLDEAISVLADVLERAREALYRYDSFHQRYACSACGNHSSQGGFGENVANGWQHVTHSPVCVVTRLEVMLAQQPPHAHQYCLCCRQPMWVVRPGPFHLDWCISVSAQSAPKNHYCAECAERISEHNAAVRARAAEEVTE